MKPRLRILACAAAMLVPAACRQSAPPEIRIGLLATFSGPYSEVSGVPARNGATLAVRGAEPIVIGGRTFTVRLIERDFEDRGDAAASAARALINQEGVHAIIGPPFSRHAIPVSVVAEDARVPMITPMASNPAVTSGKQWVFRLAFLDDLQGDVLAQFAWEDLRARSAAVLFDISTEYSRDLANRFRESFTARGGRIVAFESYTEDRLEADTGPLLRRIAARRPEVIFLPNFASAVALQMAEARRLGMRATWLGSDSWDPPSLPAMLAGERAYVTNQWRPDIPRDETRHFVAAYRTAWGIEPRATAALSHDAVRIVLDAVRRAGSLDPVALRDAIASTADFGGAAGAFTFAGRPDPVRDVAVSAVERDGLRTVRLVAP